MSKTMLICKTCGKEYEACRTPNPGIFRWRDVACSVECAEKYIRDVKIARGEITKEPIEPEVKTEEKAEMTDSEKKAEPEAIMTEIPNDMRIMKTSRKKKEQ